MSKGRIEREKQTVQKMIELYCDHHHASTCKEKDSATLCHDCQSLFDYAMARLARCPFGEKKSTCGKCTVHCYKPDQREKIIAVMRYAGPKMIRYHPILALYHLIDGWKK
ncbi:nitrous oxide-stimulated promoter family protein [Heliorestis convoluta]|uniref:Nitrous oxide-stimulated promoter family protein, putative n=1 Tax=Heliorestis convoluta TaxID=356322 RepID=A0A5Q2N0R1_9FIRM|nr:nitrous oxide-stimulated promoter family protein [Heliorestis convoluta]QGG48457.1 nitrous oxide-stimulated promoter family protein, putative [Heliorestis convoluta]